MANICTSEYYITNQDMDDAEFHQMAELLEKCILEENFNDFDKKYGTDFSCIMQYGCMDYSEIQENKMFITAESPWTAYEINKAMKQWEDKCGISIKYICEELGSQYFITNDPQLRCTYASSDLDINICYFDACVFEEKDIIFYFRHFAEILKGIKIPDSASLEELKDNFSKAGINMWFVRSRDVKLGDE